MIHVEIKPEPKYFDVEVRQKGLDYLKSKGIPLDEPLEEGTKIEAYWTRCLKDFYKAYGGVCAYLGIFFEYVTGTGSTDHYIAKSQLAGLAYEWKNFRLACVSMNRYKREFGDVLDPFEVENGWFHIEFLSGRIYPDPNLSEEIKNRVQSTIDRLRLDDPETREMRIRHFRGYLRLRDSDYLKEQSPFVWYEAKRQGLL